MIKIYISEIKEDGLPLYPALRESEVRATSNAVVRAQKHAVWRLLQLAAEHAFCRPFTDYTFTKDQCGRWECDGFYFSLSHSGKLACVALSDLPVGVDVENLSAFMRRTEGNKACALFKKIATEREKSAGYDVCGDTLAQMWTKKEAAFKRQGRGYFNPSNTESEAAKTCRVEFLDELWQLSYCSDGCAELYAVYDGGISEYKTTPEA